MATTRGASLPMPGLLWGTYPERRRARRDGLARLAEHAEARLGVPAALLRQRYRRFAEQVEAYRAASDHADDAITSGHLDALHPVLARNGLRGEALARAMALGVTACTRELGVTPFATQVMAARALLDNQLVEMATGEGKTLAVALAAGIAALAGMPVHVVTANDYLAERDAEALGPWYAALGLKVGVVTALADSSARRTAYGRDVVYCTAKELGFDYLRDHVAGHRRGDELRRRADALDGRQRAVPLLRGLCMAIVDEADSILIDEARVPLILSRAVDSRRARGDYETALRLAGRLEAGRDFQLDPVARRVTLCAAGDTALEAAVAEMPPTWRNRRYREAWVIQALSALHLYRRDRDYILRDGKVEIVDPTTGRVAAGRSWSRGLHQMIELKEGHEPTPANSTAARITFQRLFRRYHCLAGVSGTLRESSGELTHTYGLRVFRVPLRLPSRRTHLPARLFATRTELWTALAARIARLRAEGRPVLVGTDSVADSESLAAVLAEAGIPCRVLNARQDKEEADIVALAGLRAQVTVTTNMAGRGTDIPLGPGVAALGGLHVISCQHNGARRIDRQLLGRCARQGEPGSSETWLSLESDLFRRRLPDAWHKRLGGLLDRPPGQRMAVIVAHAAQRLEEAREAGARRRLLREDEDAERRLAFGGPLE
jgi:preprotein translocase subunit SecA